MPSLGDGIAPVADPSQAGSKQTAPGVLTRSTESFKVLTECPLIVMLLFQLYPRYIQVTIPSLIPMMVQTLALRPPRGSARHRVSCADFMAAQVKTLSFLTYLLRAFADLMRQYQESIPKCVIQLLLMCPPESASIRKDILVATRHILATDFRVGFFSQIDVLLDEKVLIGSGASAAARSHETLRPLACSTLADLVHHVRGELGIKHLSRVVYIFSCNIHDSSLPIGIQTTSVRLLLNLVENIFHKNDAEGRALLVRILHCLVCKFATFKGQIAKQIEARKKEMDEADAAKGEGGAPAPAVVAVITDSSALADPAAMAVLEKAKAVDKDKGGDKDGKGDKRTESKEVKQMLKTMILGVKTVVWSVSNSRQPQSAGAQKGMSESECLLVARLLKSGLECFAIYSSGPEASSQEEKDVLDYFAGVFTVLDVRNFTQVFSQQVGFMYTRVLKNNTMSTMLQHFLANSTVSRAFADLLLAFLVERIGALGNPDDPSAAVLLRLFKLVFGSVTLFPENEPLLRPHLPTIVTQAMRHAAHAAQPANFFSLLRALFKSIGGGKFEQLYKEFLPLLPSLLQGLIGAHAASHQLHVRELLLELCLTLPARLSSLLPYLQLLMRPVLHALRASHELISLALRTLEFWIDHLHPGFLAPLLSPVMRQLLLALTQQLLPAPHPFGPSALRILGKLGGRNRQSLHMREPLPCTGTAAPIFSVLIPPLVAPGTLTDASAPAGATRPATPIKLPIDAVLERALDLLQTGGKPPKPTPPSSFSSSSSAAAGSAAAVAVQAAADAPLKEAFSLVRACVCRLVTVAADAPVAADAKIAIHGVADAMMVDAMEVDRASTAAGSKDLVMWTVDVKPVASAADGAPATAITIKAIERFEAEEAMLATLYRSIALAAASPALQEPATELLVSLARHTALLIQAEAGEGAPATTRLSARPRCFVQGLLGALGTSSLPELPSRVLDALTALLDAVGTVAAGSVPHGDAAAAEAASESMRCAVGEDLFESLVHLCYTCESPCRSAVLKALQLLCETLPAHWVLSHEMALSAALLHLCEDLARPDDAAASSALLVVAMKRCHGADAPAALAAESPAVSKRVVAVLASGLSACSGGTREAAKMALRTLAGLLDVKVGELLAPLRDTHLAPLLARKLRALALPTQVAVTEAVSFCLKESSHGEGAAELLPLGPPLLSFLSDALLSAEGEETGRDQPRLLGPYARGISLDVRGRPRSSLAAPYLAPPQLPTFSAWQGTISLVSFVVAANNCSDDHLNYC